MKLKDLIKDSIYCTIGYVDEKHLETLEQYIEQNRFLLEKFNKIHIAYNGKSELVPKAFKIWSNTLKQSRIGGTELPINRGQTYGTMDLDNECIDYCKGKNIKYIWKTSSDTIFFPQILDKEIEQADFYYINGIGVGGLNNYDESYFFPQTNFYIIKNDIDYLNNVYEINEVYKLQQQYPDKRPWELKQGFESETFLKRAVERNNLTKFHLTNEKYFKNIMSVIEKYNIHDSSHKNLIIEDPGVCHLQNPGGLTYTISNLNKHI